MPQEKHQTDKMAGHSRPPQIDKVLRDPTLLELCQQVKREIVRQALRQVIEERKKDPAAFGSDVFSPESLALATRHYVEEMLESGIKRVINGTGVILSTNLGRAPLPKWAAQHMTSALQGYSNLEFDLEEGERGERTKNLSRLISLITGAEQAIVVNNNASAVMLAVKALADGKEVIVSRGELIEIGGSFRLPDVITASGAKLREVGTTNRTRATDYRAAISADTGMLLKCHRSNFQIVGFTEEAEIGELVQLNANLPEGGDVPVVFDLGGGCFVDLTKYDLSPEPTVQETIAAGADLVLFSGDKLLGGPQAGIICGKAKYVSKLRKCPIYRALRADKLVISLMEAVLSQYLYVDRFADLPVFALAARSKESLEKRARQMVKRLSSLSHLKVEAVPLYSTMGGGSLPGEKQESFALSVKSADNAFVQSPTKCETLAAFLRAHNPPVISTISKETLHIDLRCVFEEEDAQIEQALEGLNSHLKSGCH